MTAFSARERKGGLYHEPPKDPARRRMPAFDVFPAALLVKELTEGALDGRKWYYYQCDADAPCEDEEAVEKFDSQFPPKVKAWQPSQEEFYIHSHSAITW